MRITPLDVRKQEFRKAVRGYDSDEVRGFLATLAEEYEVVLVDNKNLREAIAKQEEKLADYHKLESTLRDTLMTAQRAMSESRDNATREGELIVQEARQQASQILAESRARTEEMRRETIMLRKEKETYLARFRGLAEAQLKFVDTYEQDFAESDSRLGDMATTMVTEASVPVAPATFKPTEVAPHQPPLQTPRREIPQNTESDQDVWRDCAPLNAGEPQPKAPGAKPATGWVQAPAKQPAQAATGQCWTDENTRPQEKENDTEQAVSSLTEAVEFASLGIPVQATPKPAEWSLDEDAVDPHLTAPV